MRGGVVPGSYPVLCGARENRSRGLCSVSVWGSRELKPNTNKASDKAHLESILVWSLEKRELS